MSLESDRIKGADAQHLLDNPLFVGAFKAVGDYVESKALTCNPDDKEATQRIVITKQLLAAIKREIERQVEDGLIAEAQLKELERNAITRKFRR